MATTHEAPNLTINQVREQIAADVSASFAKWREQDRNLRPAVASAIWYLRSATSPGQHSVWVERDTLRALEILEDAMTKSRSE